MARYCSYCGQKGHNRRTCPHRSDEAKEFDKKYMRKAGRRKGSTTQCSYCGGIGHNRRTCQLLKSDKAWVIKQAEVVVRSTIENLSLIGCGVGFLQKTTRWGDEYLGIHSGEIRANFRYNKTCSQSDRELEHEDRRYVPLIEVAFRLDSRDVTNSRNGTPDICFDGSYSNVYGMNNGTSRLLEMLDAATGTSFNHSQIVSESRIPHKEEKILAVLESLGKEIERHFSSRNEVSPFYGPILSDPEKIARNNTYEIFDES